MLNMKFYFAKTLIKSIKTLNKNPVEENGRWRINIFKEKGKRTVLKTLRINKVHRFGENGIKDEFFYSHLCYFQVLVLIAIFIINMFLFLLLLKNESLNSVFLFLLIIYVYCICVHLCLNI